MDIKRSDDSGAARPEARLGRGMAGAIGKSFRGGIIENCQRFQFMGSGYDSMPVEQNRYFWIASAPQLRGPMTALTDPLVRVVNIIGATQGMKSFCGDAWVPYVMEHERLAMLVLFEDDPKADIYCARRLMETLRRHPVISKMFALRAQENRHNVTGTWVETPYSELMVGGLNDGNVSSLSWPRIWISEGWQHANKGLLKKAFKRADRYPTTSKILNESQASVAGTDLHEIARRGHPVPLEWACPACGGWQTWEWAHWNFLRPADFVPRPKRKLSVISVGGFRLGARGAGQEENGEGTLAFVDEQPRPGTYAGMVIPSSKGGSGREARGAGQEEGGGQDLAGRAAGAYWECLWCGHHIEDTGPQRRQIAETYRQNYRIEDFGEARGARRGARGGEEGKSSDEGGGTGDEQGDRAIGPTGQEIKYRTPAEVTFTLPWEANPGNSFAKTVMNFLIAKEAKRQGNEIPEQDWFLSERAYFYAKGQSAALELAPVIGSYELDPAKKIPDEQARNLMIDVQKKLDAGPEEDVPGSFWVIAEAVNKLGSSWDLGRYFCTDWEELRLIQRFWKIPAGRVCIDGQKWTPEIQRRVAGFYEWEDSAPMVIKMGGAKQFRRCWRILIGDDANYYRHGRVLKPFSVGHAHPVDIIEDGKKSQVTVYHYQWSNLAVKDQLHTIMLGGEGLPKVHAISREQLAAQGRMYPELAKIIERTLAREEGDRTYERQINAEYRSLRRGKPFWDKKRPDNHYFDCRCMGGVRKLMDGLWGSQVEGTAAAPAENTEEPEKTV